MTKNVRDFQVSLSEFFDKIVSPKHTNKEKHTSTEDAIQTREGHTNETQIPRRFQCVVTDTTTATQDALGEEEPNKKRQLEYNLYVYTLYIYICIERERDDICIHKYTL